MFPSIAEIAEAPRKARTRSTSRHVGRAGSPNGGRKWPEKPIELTSAERRAVSPDDGTYAGGPALDAAALLSGLDGLPVPLATTRLQLSAAFGFLTRHSGERIILSSVCWTLLLVPLLVFNARLGAFGAKQAAVGAAAVAAHNVANVLLGCLAIWTAANYARTVPSLDSNPFATVVRWRRLLAPEPREVPCQVPDLEPGEEPDVSPLVRHNPEDPLCPCPLPSCAGPVLTSTWIMYLVDPIVQSLILFAAFFLASYTLLVTFAPLMWSTWWSILLFALFACATLAYTPVTHFILPYNAPSSRVLNLSGRLQHRALSLLLSDMVERHRAAVEGGPEPVPAADEPYVALHLRLAESWPAQLAFISNGRFVLILMAANLVAWMLFSAVLAGCVPLWIPVMLLLWPIAIGDELVAVAAANARTGRAADLYRRTRSSVLLLRSRAHNQPAVARSLADHDALLSLFAQTEGARARFVGFVVDAGVVRTVAVTCVTLCFGLWTVLRAAGVYFTLETMCAG
ncbi:hypothetical protein DFJ74DRAFT_742141 [Hyaloraphidium curvatum]|nr:hypothetical protein DFJ74DRAFT_742141 [Hyaloraphidium curvatum]